jgi:Tol biopolymer transport system component/uncharacterized RDD family membrane protein YckC
MTYVAPVQQEVTDGEAAARNEAPLYRILAFLVDVLAVLVTLLPLLVGSVLVGIGLGYLAGAVLVALGVYLTMSVWLTRGLTPGKALFGLAVRRIDGSKPARDLRGLAWSAGRHSAGYAVADVFGIRAAWALARRKDRCPHDRAFNSIVVLSPKVPGAAARLRHYGKRLDKGIERIGEQYGWPFRLARRLARLTVLPATLVVGLAGKDFVGSALGTLGIHISGLEPRAQAAVHTPVAEPMSTKASIGLWSGSGTATAVVIVLLAPPFGSPDVTDINVVFSNQTVNQPATSEIYVMKADGRGERPLTTNDVPDHYPDLFDDRRIVFASERDGNVDLYVMDADGRNERRLTRHEAADTQPVWSGDGERIAFVSDRAGNRDIYVVDADGTDLRRLTKDDADDADPSWSPDDDELVFASDREEGNWDLYVVEDDGTDLRRITTSDADEWSPVWAPDEDRIAFVSERDDNTDVYTIDADGTEPRQLTRHEADDDSPRWSPDGKQVLFWSERGLSDEADELYAVDADGGRPRQLTNMNR